MHTRIRDDHLRRVSAFGGAPGHATSFIPMIMQGGQRISSALTPQRLRHDLRRVPDRLP